MSKSATEDALQALHKLVADTLVSEIRAVHTDDEGKPKPKSPQLLAQAIKFLKDNGIEPAKDVQNEALDRLSKEVDDVLKDPEKLSAYVQ